MSDISYSEQLRNLSKDYYQNHIRFSEYRSQRKVIIDIIDEEFNGRKAKIAEAEIETGNESSVFMDTIAFFKNTDVDE